MTDKIIERACAKINLFLDVTGMLDGGYHAVSTVMQTVSLCDDITISDIRKVTGAPSFSLSCDDARVPCDGNNLAIRAALLFCEAAGVSLSAHIDIVKRIPMAAGLAGGSADGAAVLRGLDRALGMPLSLDELCKLGARLGADVPFCISGGTRYADGRGDILHALPALPHCYFVICCEGEGVSTPWAYRRLDELYGGFDGSLYSPRDTSSLFSALSSGDISAVAANIYNIFEAPVLSERPVAADVKATLEGCGALSAMMSGSGPSVFGIFADGSTAKNAAERLISEGFAAHICRPV